MSILNEAKRLHDLGLAIHWLKPKSKVPVESGWTSGERKSFSHLKKNYRNGMNIGVRLGHVNDLKGYGLYVVDVDIKSTDEKDLKAAMKEVQKLGLDDSISVMSGRGNGSLHIYFKSKKEIRTFRVTQSPKKVKVHMPSAKPTRHELLTLSETEIKKGLRLRAAFEISVLGEGAQVVLPPSIHPDSNKAYKWCIGPIDTIKEIPAWEGEELAHRDAEKGLSDLKGQGEVFQDFEVEDVDLFDGRLKMDVVAQIVDGEGVEDRSATLFTVSMQMLRLKFSDNEILSVLTDESYFLGQAGFEHAKTRSRKRAAKWVFDYTLKKAKQEVSLENYFDDVSEIEFDETVYLKGEANHFKKDDLENLGDWKNKLERNPDGKIKNNFQNHILILKGVNDFSEFVSLNEFLNEAVWMLETPWGSLVGKSVDDMDLIKIKNYLSKYYGIDVVTERIMEAIQFISDESKFHPVRQYLETLEWDGVERIETWLKDYLGAEGPDVYLRAVSKKFLIKMIARIYEPGCKADEVLILEGNQGIGKSTAVEVLASPWFSDAQINVQDKDSVLNIQGVWVYELGELSAMRRAEVEVVKAFISRRVDKIRPPYGRLPKSYPRQVVFIGTTNNEEYLKDPTGARRFWPVKITRPNVEGLKAIRHQLLAEALAAYKVGEIHWIDYEESAVANEVHVQQGKRFEVDELEDLLGEFLNKNWELFKDGFRIQDLIEQGPSAFQGLRNDRSLQTRLGPILRRLGYENRVKKIGREVVRKWRKKRGN